MLEPGAIIGGRYQIVRLLGGSDFVSIFFAIDAVWDQRCIVKLINLSVKDTRNSEEIKIENLLRQKIEFYRRLSHPQIGRIFCFFKEDDKLYLVEEFINGRNLSKELTHYKRFNEVDVIELLEEILQILKVIHKYDLIHGDIKPTNLIRRFPDGNICLIHSIISLEIFPENPTLRVNNFISRIDMLTDGYKPIEQREGYLDRGSDIYAVGMIAIQALTGNRPEHIQEDPMTRKLIWRNHAKVSYKLEKILDRMVEPHLRNRYESADEVLTDLRDLKKTMIVLPIVDQIPSQFISTFALASGAAFLGGLTGLIPGAIIGATFGAIFGLFSRKTSTPRSSSPRTQRLTYISGDRIIAMASGGAFLGGLTAQVPGAIIGAMLGAIFGYFAKPKMAEPR